MIPEHQFMFDSMTKYIEQQQRSQFLWGRSALQLAVMIIMMLYANLADEYTLVFWLLGLVSFFCGFMFVMLSQHSPIREIFEEMLQQLKSRQEQPDFGVFLKLTYEKFLEWQNGRLGINYVGDLKN